MVATVIEFRRREGEDINNFNFITDMNPNGITDTGLPSYREITSNDFVQSTWSNNHYKQIATDDTYGFYSKFLLRPGMRKIEQKELELTIIQSTAGIEIPSILTGMFGFRPVLYDEATDTTTPLQDFYNFAQATHPVTDELKFEFSDRTATSPSPLLESVFAIPPPIDFTAGGVYKDKIMTDLALFTPWRIKTTIQKGNVTYTTHEMQLPLILNTPDSAALPAGIQIEAKAQIYLWRSNFGAGIDTPYLSPIPNENVVSFYGYVDVL
jgi:hypothetical protein